MTYLATHSGAQELQITGPRLSQSTKRVNARYPWLLVLGFLAATPSSLEGQLVRGQVVDSLTGEPIPQSTVILTNPDGVEVDQTVSDIRGFYLLRAPASGSYQLIVVKEGYRVAPFPPFDVEPDQLSSFVLMIVPRVAGRDAPDSLRDELAATLCGEQAGDGQPTIVGIVRDAATGRPVPGAVVHLSVPGGFAEQTENEIRAIETDDRGAYAVCSSPILSRVTAHAIAADRMSGFVALLFGTGGVFRRGAFQPMAGSVWRQDLELLSPEQRGATLTGVVSDTSGTPAAGATVEIVGTPHQTRTDRAGRFEFSRLTHGDLRVQAKQVGYAPAEFDVELPAGGTVRIPDDMLTLGQFPVRLRDIIVTGDAAMYAHPRLDGFFHRRETSPRGKFVTRDEWQKWMHFELSDILNRTRYTLLKVDGCRQPSSAYVDGVYLPPGFSVEAFVDRDRLVAIEAYGNGMDAPRRYRRHRCGSVILFWTTR